MKIIRNSFLLGMLVAVPAMGLAQTPAAKPAPAQTATPATTAKPAAKAAKVAAKKDVVHATKGVVKSMDATSLVITGSGAKAKELTFVLNTATVKTGTPAVGSTVSVRYKTDAAQNIATAVTVAPKAKAKK